MSAPRRVAFYARVSTDGQTVVPQLDALRAVAAARGWQVVEEYIDHGVSGARDRRLGLDKLVADAHRARFSVVAIWKLDRLARSLRHLILLADELRALGIDLVSTEDAIDTTTPAGRFTFHVLGAVAELERELGRERTRSGLAAAKRRGAKLGRPRMLAGIDAVRLAERRASGVSVRQIARESGVDPATVRRALARHEAKTPTDGGSETSTQEVLP